MEKKLYKGQKHTLYQIAKDIGVRPYTLYRLDNMDKVYKLSTKIFLDMAKIEEEEPFHLIKEIEHYFEKGIDNEEEKGKDLY